MQNLSQSYFTVSQKVGLQSKSSAAHASGHPNVSMMALTPNQRFARMSTSVNQGSQAPNFGSLNPGASTKINDTFAQKMEQGI